jgi:hypothetical protein
MPPRKKKEVPVVAEEHAHNPAVAALLNFLIWGTGYIYNRRRVAFGVGMLIVEIFLVPVFLLRLSTFMVFPLFIYPFAFLILALLLAYDGYKEAVKMKSI